MMTATDAAPAAVSRRTGVWPRTSPRRLFAVMPPKQGKAAMNRRSEASKTTWWRGDLIRFGELQSDLGDPAARDGMSDQCDRADLHGVADVRPPTEPMRELGSERLSPIGIID